MKKVISKLILSSIFTIYAMLSGLSVMAADTEIFFAGPTLDAEKPNVLFLLNTAGSFNATVENVPSFCGGADKQFSVMQCIMANFAENNDQLNIGFMRYNNPAGPVSYPVRDPKTPLPGATLPIINSTLTGSDNDLLQTGTDGVDLVHTTDGTSMVLGEAGSVAAFRFENVSIPQGATVTKATIKFAISDEVTPDLTGDVNLIISVENSITIGSESESIAFVSSETLPRIPTTGVNTNWLIPSADVWATAGDEKSTSDFKASINPLIQDSDWCGENNVSVFISPALGSTGTRTIATEDSTITQKPPKLVLEWDDSSIGTSEGCYRGSTNVTIGNAADDEEDVQKNASTIQLSSNAIDLDLALANGNGAAAYPVLAVGLLFRDVGIPSEAEIESSYVQLVSENLTQTSAFSTNISAIVDPAFTGWTDEFSSLATSSASVSWSDTPNDVSWANSQVITTPDLSSIIQEMVDSASWSPGTATNIPLVLKSTASSDRRLKSADGQSPAHLIVNYKGKYVPGSALNNISSEMVSVLFDFVQGGNQASVDTYLEAYRYFIGDPIVYGGSRFNSASKRISHPLSYQNGKVIFSGNQNSPPYSNIPSTEAACLADYPNNVACKSERIIADGATVATYKSPITDQCQQNHIVLLVDGDPFPVANDDNASTEVIETIKTLTENPVCNNSASTSGHLLDCGYNLASYLANTDLITDDNSHFNDLSLNNEDQIINTHAIHFGKTSNLTDTQKETRIAFPVNMAKSGDGYYFEAESGADLVVALNDLGDSLGKVNTSFVAAGITVNQSNRLTHRDELYFSLFRPEPVAMWPGNLKRYRIFDGAIVDFNGNEAIDSNSDTFKSPVDGVGGAESWWTGFADGNDADVGGAASKLDYASSDRFIFSNLTGNSGITYSSNGGKNKLNLSNSNPGLGADTWDSLLITSLTDTTNTLKWIMGRNADNTSHNQIGDPLHSKPTIITYRQNDNTGNPELLDMVFVGTNTGFLHGFLTATGVEQWSFIPKTLLNNINNYLVNEETNPALHDYGVDGSIEIYIDDFNGDGAVDVADGEKAYLYVGLRRGGSSYYAFDITDHDDPELMFVIEAPDTFTIGHDYNGLEQSWSKPQVEKLADSSQTNGYRLVMVFGGGYNDIVQDPTSSDPTGGAPDLTDRGQTIFIADALTGVKIWDAQTNAIQYKQAGLKGNMGSIPADIKLVHLRHPEYFDHLYAADNLGQIFRFDFDLDWDGLSGSGGANDLSKGGMLAEIQTDEDDNSCTTNTCNRRFYFATDIAFIQRPNGLSFVSVSVGSGYRAHPLGLENSDAFYVIRDMGVLQSELFGDDSSYVGSTPYNKTGFSRFDNHNEPSIAADGSTNSIFGGDGSELITLANLESIRAAPEGSTAVDAVESLGYFDDSGLAFGEDGFDSDTATTNQKVGWYLTLDEGEKVLASSITFNNRVIFTTYIPPGSDDAACLPPQGRGRAYAVNVVDGTPFGDTNNDNSITHTDRYINLNNIGIPPSPQIIVLDTGSEVLVGREVATDKLLGNDAVGEMVEMQKWRERSKR